MPQGRRLVAFLVMKKNKNKGGSNYRIAKILEGIGLWVLLIPLIAFVVLDSSVTKTLVAMFCVFLCGLFHVPMSWIEMREKGGSCGNRWQEIRDFASWITLAIVFIIGFFAVLSRNHMTE